MPAPLDFAAQVAGVTPLKQSRLDARPKFDQRREEIGLAKRARTREQLFNIVFKIIGHDNARIMNIEEFCATAGIARGTFYNYFVSIDDMLKKFANELGHSLFLAVTSALKDISEPAELLAKGARYYFRWAMQHPSWAWAMINTTLGGPIYGAETNDRVRVSIQRGMDSGVFSVSDSVLGRDVFVGIGLVGTMSLLRGTSVEGYPEQATKAILLSLGASKATADRLVKMPLSDLAMFISEPSIDSSVDSKVAADRAPTKRRRPAKGARKTP